MNVENDGPDTWDRYQKLVVKTLADLNDGQTAMQKEIAGMRVDIAMLKVKSGIWGFVGGLLVAVAAALMGKK